MVYRASWHEKALEDLKSIDTQKARLIVDKVKNYLVTDPMSLGKPLAGEFSGFYRYRAGAYRIIYAVDRRQQSILILRVGHRKDVYGR